MIWPLIDPINASTKSSSKLTVATHAFNASRCVVGCWWATGRDHSSSDCRCMAWTIHEFSRFSDVSFHWVIDREHFFRATYMWAPTSYSGKRRELLHFRVSDDHFMICYKGPSINYYVGSKKRGVGSLVELKLRTLILFSHSYKNM